MLGFFDRDRTDQNRLTFRVRLADFLDDCVPFVAFVEIHFVLLVNAGNRKVRGNNNAVQFVNFLEFHRLGCRRTRHA